jgi:hypothetical protein
VIFYAAVERVGAQIRTDVVRLICINQRESVRRAVLPQSLQEIRHPLSNKMQV